MRLEYFQLIDRIVELDLGKQNIHVEAVVPTASTIFEGHFPGMPLMPGVLLLECMAQTAGWLIIALTKFERMPFFVGANGLKRALFVAPGRAAGGPGRFGARGMGLRGPQGAPPGRRKAGVRSRDQ